MHEYGSKHLLFPLQYQGHNADGLHYMACNDQFRRKRVTAAGVSCGQGTITPRTTRPSTHERLYERNHVDDGINKLVGLLKFIPQLDQASYIRIGRDGPSIHDNDVATVARFNAVSKSTKKASSLSRLSVQSRQLGCINLREADTKCSDKRVRR